MRVRLARAGTVAAIAATALFAGGCGGSTVAGRPRATAPASTSLAAVQVIPMVTLHAGRATRLPLPAGGAAVSFDVTRTAATVDFGIGERMLTVNGTLPRRVHVEIAAGHVAVDGRVVATGWPTTGDLIFQPVRPSSRVTALIVTPASEPAALLLHRLAELHARLTPAQFPIGADTDDRLHDSPTYWTSGFWPGALWQAAALEPAGGMFARWALAATIAHFGHEREDTHDVGFMYEQSSVAAYMALCLSGRKPVALCSRLKRSALAAANQLMRLAAGNARAGTIPTSSRGPQADTIVDSMMNLALLPWATQVTGNPTYARLASRHAHRVAALLVRADGSTTQAVNFDRATGRVLSFATHQGLSVRSTWARGEGWALYGFAVAATELRDQSLLRVAERIAGYVSRHLPAEAVPRWDYDAPSSAPVDVSAGMITAAGLLHLALACEQLEPSCPAAPGWMSLSRRMLGDALAFAATKPPLGLLSSQILDEHSRGSWSDGGELIFGLTYGLETVALQRRS